MVSILLQETKQKGQEIMEIEDYIFLNSGSENRMLGTGFIINKDFKKAIIEFNPVSDRLCYIRLSGKYQKITFINIHAPTEEAKLEDKEDF